MSTSSSPPAEPSTKRVLRDVIVMNQEPCTSAAHEVIVSSSGVSADFFVEAERWKAELEKLAGLARSETWSWTHAVPLAVALARTWIRFSGQGGAGTSVTFGERNKNDRLSCQRCAGVLHCAVTVPCGHSFCKKCAASMDHCTKCGRPSADQQPETGSTAPARDSLRSNVAVQRLVEKWWANELRAVDLRNDGNRAFAEQRYDEALDKYNQAVQSGTFLPGSLT